MSTERNEAYLIQSPVRTLPSQPNASATDVSTLAIVLVAAIYTRYSKLEQGVRSETRQNEVSMQYASRVNATLYKTYSDRGRTGTTILGRPGLDALMQDAREGKFNLVIIEDLDRVGRVMSGLHKVFNELQRLGVEIHEVNGTTINTMSLLLKGLQSVEGRITFLDRSINGRRARVRKGLIPHRIRYGYCKGDRKGERTVHPPRAAVILQIFIWAAAGHGMAEIAASLTNKEPTPGDCVNIDAGRADPGTRSRWTPDMIISIIRCPLYKGLIVDSATKPKRNELRRVVGYEARDISEHVFGAAPEELVIVDPVLWQAAYEIVESAHEAKKIAESAAKHLFTGRLKCGACQEPMMSLGQHGERRYVCPRSKKRTCEGSGRPRVADVEIAIVSAIVELVEQAAYFDGYTSRYAEALVAKKIEIASHRATLIEKIHQFDDEIERLPECVTRYGFAADIVEARLIELAGERSVVAGELHKLPILVDETRFVPPIADLKSALRAVRQHAPIRGTDPDTRNLMRVVRGIVNAAILERGKGGQPDRITVELNFAPQSSRGSREPVERISLDFSP